MAMQIKPLVSILGLRVTGDLGPVTMYTSRRGKVVVFDKAPPLTPQTARQLIMRSRWRAAADAWKAMSEADRETWRAAAAAAKLSIPAYQFWIFASTKPNSSGIVKTVERQSGITLPNKP